MGPGESQSGRCLPNQGIVEVVKISPPPIKKTDGRTTPGPVFAQCDRGYQLQARSSAQEFRQFLKTLEAAGHGTKTLWARLVRQVYDKFVLARNFCSLGIVFWVLGQLWYNGTTIISALKECAFKMGLSTILCAFCYGIVAFMTNPKYAHVPGNHVGPTGRLQGQDSTADDIESTRPSDGPSHDIILGLDRRDESDRLS